MVVGMGDDPSVGEYERLLLSMKTTARKELILLHPDRFVIPGSTREWLKVLSTCISSTFGSLTCDSLVCIRIDPGFTNISMSNFRSVQACFGLL